MLFISYSLITIYLKGIFNGFSGSRIPVALTIFKILLSNETTVYDHLVYYSTLYHIIVATNSYVS